MNAIQDKFGTCGHCGGQSFGGRCTKAMLHRFDAVKDAADWRGPIDKIIPYEALTETVAAIRFYTATEAEWQDSQSVRGIKMVRVQAVGYRAGPAGP